MRDQRDRPRLYKVIVKNLPPVCTKEHIEEVFSAYGRINYLDFIKAAGKCYVAYETPEAKTKSLRMDRGLIDNVSIKVEELNPPPPPGRRDFDDNRRGGFRGGRGAGGRDDGRLDRRRSRSPPPFRRGRSRSPPPFRRGRSRSPPPFRRGRSRSPSPPSRRGRSRSPPAARKLSRSRSPAPYRANRSRSPVGYRGSVASQTHLPQLKTNAKMLGFGSNSPIGIPTKTDAIKYKKAHDLLTSQRMSKVLKLKNGEQMGWAEVGDKNGIPVIWFSGPCSNRFIIAIYHDICIQLGIRLIAFDRPGRGASTPLRHPKDWSFASWSSYIDEATDILEMPLFYVVGHSFGCSYIMASYDQLKHKIVGGFRFLATWAPSNLPCMPTSYALQRSLPTKMIRALTSFQQNSTVSSLSYQATPCQMGKIGNREKEIMNDFCNREILERLGDDHLGDSYAAYELDWLLALEVQKPLGYNHRSIKVPIKCWHGMDDSITPLGAAMWMQREMDSFLLYAVEGATHNIHLDLAIVKAMFADICAENLAGKARVEIKKQQEKENTATSSSSASSTAANADHAMEKQDSTETLTNGEETAASVSDALTSVDPSVPGFEESGKKRSLPKTTMMSSEFSALSKEYQATLDKDFLESQKEMKTSASATFEDYSSLYSKMTQQVKGKLTSLKSKKTSKLSATLAMNQAKKSRQMESESERDEDSNAINLDWEEDTNSDTCSDREELIEFRTDLDVPHQASQPINIHPHVAPDAITPSSTLTALDLDDHFQKELSKASILADFHERYILSTLEKKRNGVAVDLQAEARRLWQETVDANPLVALENISRALLSGEARLESGAQENQGASIRELASDEQNIPLSRGSHHFAAFIPSAAPRLDVEGLDEELLKKLK